VRRYLVRWNRTGTRTLGRAADIRYLDQCHGLYFAVSGRKTCVSVINAGVRRVSLSEPIAVLRADDRTYAGYPTSTFELSWAQSVPAAHRIKELLEERPRAVGG
jgi:hypothetical protein